MVGGKDDSQTDSKRQRDFDDLQNELAGRDVGRHVRFRNKHDSEQETAERRNARMQTQLSALEAMLRDNPEYAALYKKTEGLLDRAEKATDNAIDQAMQDLLQREEALNELLDNANRLPDGTRVFRSEDGSVFNEHGQPIDAEDAQSIVWKDGAPTYEDLMQQKQKMDEVRKRIEDLQHYQIDVLGRARDRMNDQHDPITPEEMEQIQDDIINKADAYVQNVIQPQSDANNVEATVSMNLDKPPI